MELNGVENIWVSDIKWAAGVFLVKWAHIAVGLLG